MHRLLVETELLSSDCPTLPKDAANHLKVLRPKKGEAVELFDGRGKWRVFAFDGAGLRPSFEICAMPRPAAELTLFACVTKGSRWDWTIEKATELGVTRIVPVISERTIVRLAPSECEAKRLRWQRVAEDAARQSDAKWLPEIHAPVTFAESLPLVRETTCFVGALTIPPPKTIGEALAAVAGRPPYPGTHSTLGAHSTSGTHFSVFVGPEGDFTPDELAALLEIATPTGFGATILRAETAAIYAISALKTFLDAQVGAMKGQTT